MKKLVLKIFCLFGIVSILCSLYCVIFFFAIPPQYIQSFQGALIDKVERLESIEGPKIILAGNSNLAFGMDSRLLEEKTGMPVVNLGLHGGLGNDFQERIARLNVQQGDIVVIANSNYKDGSIQKNLMWITVENHKELMKIPDFLQWIDILPALPDYLFNKMSLYFSGRGNQIEDLEYTRGAFNAYGDNVCIRNESKYKFKQGDINVPQIDEKNIKEINDFNKFCEERGAALVIAGYPIADGEYTPNRELYKEFQRELEGKVECTIISDFTDYFYPYSYFYDTALHLTTDGAKLRTEQLYDDLELYMK